MYGQVEMAMKSNQKAKVKYSRVYKIGVPTPDVKFDKEEYLKLRNQYIKNL